MKNRIQKTQKNMFFSSMFILVLGLLCSCEKAVFNDSSSQASGDEEQVTVVMKISDIEAYVNGDLTRARVPVSQVCTKLCFAVYQNGERVKYDNQKVSESDFGTMTMSLDPGTYQLLIIGHSGNENPSTTKPNQVKFTNLTSSGGTGYTDTFYYYGTLVVSSGMGEQQYVLNRATAMFRLMTDDGKPSSVKRFYFYYTGGSGGLDATTGYGNVNSQQKVYFDLDATTDGEPLTFELFTFPHADSKVVTFKVEALNGNDEVLYSKEFKVTMERNTITQYTGAFFTDGEPDLPDEPDEPDTPQGSTSVYVDTEWDSTNEFTY